MRVTSNKKVNRDLVHTAAFYQVAHVREHKLVLDNKTVSAQLLLPGLKRVPCFLTRCRIVDLLSWEYHTYI